MLRQRISLANKCMLLFGGAVVLIVLIALTVPWLRMNALVDEDQLELSRQMVEVWERLEAEARPPRGGARRPDPVEHAGITARLLSPEQAAAAGRDDPFVARALTLLGDHPRRADVHEPSWRSLTREYRYAKAVRAPGRDALLGLILLERRSYPATRLLLTNTAYLLTAGTLVLGLAVLVFYQITHRLILGPVRSLKETAQRVRAGDLTIRSQISTGDEFQELAETFNSMLADLSGSQDQLRAINAAMDLKLTELSEMNTALYESAKLKGEFLASVSHELRTPLNSIIGFAELLLEIAREEVSAAQGAGADTAMLSRRVRYLENIHTAARSLLDMINDLLEMAKIESGRLEVRVEPMVLRDVCEALVGLISPLAEKKQITLELEVAHDIPQVRTDIKKFQQIIFNFLSNAVKFTPASAQSGRGELVTLRAEKLVGTRGEERVRVSVIDTGPGIPPQEHEKIFEKFHQLRGGHAREHSGTGLGLAICKQLAGVLGAEIQVVSDVGRGSMFSLIMPLNLDEQHAAQAQLEGRFRGTLAGRRVWAEKAE